MTSKNYNDGLYRQKIKVVVIIFDGFDTKLQITSVTDRQTDK